MVSILSLGRLIGSRVKVNTHAARLLENEAAGMAIDFLSNTYAVRTTS